MSPAGKLVTGGAEHDVVVVGASSGGVFALRELVAALPADFPASLFVVIHTAPGGPGLLAPILDAAGPLPARFPKDGERIHPGHVYVAPPDLHLLVRPGHIHLSRGPKENRSRPAVNPLFRTAADSYGRRVTAAVLTGSLDDGTSGMLAVRHAGGTTVVQAPHDALFPGMPLSVLEHMEPDHVVPLSEIPLLLTALARRERGEAQPASEGREAREEEAPMPPYRTQVERIEQTHARQPSGFTCPDCSGALWDLRSGDLHEYICRIGHRYSPQALLLEQGVHRNEAMEMALRHLREEVEMAAVFAERSRERGSDSPLLDDLDDRARRSSEVADQLEELIRERAPRSEDPSEEAV